MLTSRFLLRRGHASYFKWSYASHRRFAQMAEDPDEVMINLDVRLATLRKKKPQRAPFVKNMFLGQFDNEVVAYPEVQTNERQDQFNEWLAPIQECVNRNFDPKETDENILPFQALEQLRELGVFRASLTLEDKGMDLTATEYAKLVEVLGKNPALASYFISRTDPIDILVKYGSDEQKKQYLPRFVSGELIPTLAIQEDNNTGNLTSLNSTAVATPCKKYWKLSAKKLCVLNGNQANCFIVVANCTETDDPFHRPEAATLFIVERDHGGVSSSEPLEKLGQRGLKICTVNFTDTLVPRENMLTQIGGGPEILINLLTSKKYNIGSQAIAILRRLIDDITKYAINKKHYDKQLMGYDFVQEVIAKMTRTLYTIESMTYLTTGLIDQYEDQDINVENAIVEAYSTRECLAQVFQGLQLLGRQSYVNNSPFERIYRDALALSLFNERQTDLHTYIAVMGLHQLGMESYDRVKKQRNPLMYPKFIFKEIFSSKQGPDLAIEEHLHPSLQISAKMIQECVFMLTCSAEVMLIQHGAKVSEVNMELRRLAEMAMDIYAMSAAVARASRSYCIGLKHSKDDILIAHTVCFNGFHRVKINHTEIQAGETQNCDDLFRKISRRVFQQKGYFPQDPLQKNF